MNKRTFIKTLSAVFGGSFLTQLPACAPKSSESVSNLKNWAGNLEFSTSNVHYPNNVADVQEIIKKCNKLTALGSRHSFNRIADNTENLISTKNLNKVVSIDKVKSTVTVEAGMKYGELCSYLHENGFALHNLASLPHISIAGSVATATHGSGVRNGNLATSVSGIEFVNAGGEVISLSRGSDDFDGAVVALGSLGVVTKITLDLLPTFQMRQLVYRNMPMDQLEKNFEAIMSSGYSVSLFTNWKNRNINEVWIKSRVDENEQFSPATDFFGAVLADRNMHPVEEQSAETCTEQMGIPGPWYERMPHFKMGFQPSTGKELQCEYFVPLEDGYNAIMAVEKLSEKISPHLFISEIRSVAADDLWMSTAHRRASVAIHTTWKQVEEVMDLIPLMEKQLEPFNARPHWAKLFTMPPAILQSRYERLTDFKKLVSRHDPKKKFQNEFLKTNLFQI